jgi:replicative DNA helicase
MDVIDLSKYDGPDRVISSVTFSEMIKSRPAIAKHKTGISGLDAAIDGFEPGELIVISGPTAMGKTTLCDTIVQNLNTIGKRSLFFTFENTPQKMVAIHAEPETSLYLPLEHKAKDLKWLRDRCVEAIQKFSIAAIFIDHLHYVIDMAMKGNVSLEIGATMRFLKREIALELNIPVFIVCHSTKMSFDVEPSMQHLRDSSFVAQEADTVLIVFRRFDLDYAGMKLQTMLQGLSTIKIDKARRTGTMGLKVKVKKDGHRIVESLDEPEEKDSATTAPGASRPSRSRGRDYTERY